MVDAGSKLTYEEKMRVPGPRSRLSTDESVFDHLYPKRFWRSLIHLTTKQTKENAEACKHTQMIQMLKTKNK